MTPVFNPDQPYNFKVYKNNNDMNSFSAEVIIKLIYF